MRNCIACSHLAFSFYGKLLKSIKVKYNDGL
jgi:hypothetical protein